MPPPLGALSLPSRALVKRQTSFSMRTFCEVEVLSTWPAGPMRNFSVVLQVPCRTSSVSFSFFRSGLTNGAGAKAVIPVRATTARTMRRIRIEIPPFGRPGPRRVERSDEFLAARSPQSTASSAGWIFKRCCRRSSAAQTGSFFRFRIKQPGAVDEEALAVLAAEQDQVVRARLGQDAGEGDPVQMK